MIIGTTVPAIANGLASQAEGMHIGSRKQVSWIVCRLLAGAKKLGVFFSAKMVKQSL